MDDTIIFTVNRWYLVALYSFQKCPFQHQGKENLQKSKKTHHSLMEQLPVENNEKSKNEDKFHGR